MQLCLVLQRGELPNSENFHTDILDMYFTLELANAAALVAFRSLWRRYIDYVDPRRDTQITGGVNAPVKACMSNSEPVGPRRVCF